LQKRAVIIKLPVLVVMVVMRLQNIAMQYRIVEITLMRQTAVTAVMNKVVLR
jgi:hypothetical protein